MAKPRETTENIDAATQPGVHGCIEYKWIALSVTTIGALMSAIDSTIVILALPDMMVKLHADLIEMIWVIMGYILISTVFLLTFGRVADMFGRVRLYNPRLCSIYYRLGIMWLIAERDAADSFPISAGRGRGADDDKQSCHHHRSLSAQ